MNVPIVRRFSYDARKTALKRSASKGLKGRLSLKMEQN
jgi:hypothetical protein